MASAVSKGKLCLRSSCTSSNSARREHAPMRRSQSSRGARHQIRANTRVRTHARTHPLIPSFTLVFCTRSLAAAGVAGEARTLINSPALILLTFCRDPSHLPSPFSHPLSHRGGPRLASVDASHGAPAAHRSGFWLGEMLWARGASAPPGFGTLSGLYDRRVNQAIMAVIISNFVKGYWGVQWCVCVGGECYAMISSGFSRDSKYLRKKFAK